MQSGRRATVVERTTVGLVTGRSSVESSAADRLISAVRASPRPGVPRHQRAAWQPELGAEAIHLYLARDGSGGHRWRRRQERGRGGGARGRVRSGGGHGAAHEQLCALAPQLAP
eukprot:scaffold16768_cov38-Phaeocystis_antarctica.AAC.1